MSKTRRLEAIFESEPSLDENGSRNIIRDINTKKDWICYGGDWDGDMVEFAERYINTHATQPGILGPLNTSQPIHVLRVMKDNTYGRIDALLYANGAVIVQTKDIEDRKIYVWVEKRVAELHRYPIPKLS